MNPEEYKKWERDASAALSQIYCAEDVTTVIDWFRSIKGQGERELLGNERIDAWLVFATGPSGGLCKHWSLYNSLMSRIFIYAPFIIEEARNGS